VNPRQAAIAFMVATLVNTFVTLLSLAFISAKLLHQVQWSWLWVLSPVWLSVLAACAAFIAGVGKPPRC
jgi:hypothetical protein